MSQLWQQQLLYKQLQLQELQRQQQQQQNQQQNQQHNQMTEMPSWQNPNPSQMVNPHQSFQGQMTEMPSNWPNMVPNPNPQMLFPPGNMNWAQYSMNNQSQNPVLMSNFQNGMLMQQNSQQNQLQTMRNMGMLPQQLDTSIYQTSQFLPMSSNNNTNNNTNNNEGLMSKSGAQSDAFSPYQQSVPDPQNSTNSMQNFLGGSSFTNPPAHQSAPAQSSLDPEEEKLLYGDDNWIGSFGKSVVSSTGGGSFVNSMEDGGNNNNNNNNGGNNNNNNSNNNFGGGLGFGGSWSALMQDALEVSSSETGQNEEWSGLAVRSKNEPVQNQSAFQQNSNNNQFGQNQEQTQLGNGIWGQDNNNGNNNSNNANQQFMQQRGQQGIWVQQQNRQQAHHFTNQNQAGNNNSNNNKHNGWNSNNALAQTGDNNNNANNNASNNNGSNIYAMQPPKNFGMMTKANQEMSGVRRHEESKQESPILFPNPNPNPNSVGSGGGYSPAQLGMQMGQNIGGNLGMNFGASNHPFGSFPLLQSQMNQQMVKSQEQQRFNEPALHSDKRDDELNARGGAQSKDTLFNGAIPLFSQNRINQQPSQNVLELFQKAEKPPKSDPPMPDQSDFDTSSPNPPQNQHLQNFGLMLGPPSQRTKSMDPDHHAPGPSTSFNQHHQQQQSIHHSNSQNESNTDNTDQNRPKELKEPSGTSTGTAGTMFKNVWTNVSTQPRNKIITPSIVQSMMLNRANANISEQNSAGTGTGEAGTSSASSVQEERQLFDKNALNAPVGSKRGLNSEENILHGRPLSGPTQQNNYSLLNQVQSMRSTDLDAGNVNRLAKRLRPDHGGPGAPPVTDVNNNKASVGPHGGKERSPGAPAGAPSELADRPKVNPQMAPSWFEQYGNYRNGQNIPSVNESPQRNNAAQQFSFPKVAWNNLDNNSNNKNNSNNINNNSGKMASEQGMERSPVTPISRFGPQAVAPVHNNNININNNTNNSMNNNNNNVVPVQRLGANEAVPTPPVQSGALTPPPVKEKSRKTGTRKMTPFHKVTEVPESIISTSMAEMDWAQTANRLFDKVDDDTELIEDSQLALALSRRRLTFTTKLTQHLVPAVPPRFLRARADASHESVLYFVSSFALRDACSLIGVSKNEAADEKEKENNSLAEKSANVEKGGEQFFNKVVEGSNVRFKRLEEDFVRLNKRTSVLDLQLECQELERFSIVNRLGKFHGRGHALTDASPAPSPSRPFFHRAVTPVPLPGPVSDPSSTHCLSL